LGSVLPFRVFGEVLGSVLPFRVFGFAIGPRTLLSWVILLWS
jgi:hypothetical protein